jgi:hypothetical protein
MSKTTQTNTTQPMMSIPNTPVKSTRHLNLNPPSQKPLHREAKATTKLLNGEYESDSSDSDYSENSESGPNKSFFVQKQNQTSSEPNFLNLSEILPKNNPNDESEDEADDYESILRQVITDGLMSGLENMHQSPTWKKTKQSFQPPNSELNKRTRGLDKNSGRLNRTNMFKPNLTNNQTPTQPNGFLFGTPESNQQNSSRQPNQHQEAQMVKQILETLFGGTPSK